MTLLPSWCQYLITATYSVPPVPLIVFPSGMGFSWIGSGFLLFCMFTRTQDTSGRPGERKYKDQDLTPDPRRQLTDAEKRWWNHELGPADILVNRGEEEEGGAKVFTFVFRTAWLWSAQRPLCCQGVALQREVNFTLILYTRINSRVVKWINTKNCVERESVFPPNHSICYH